EELKFPEVPWSRPVGDGINLGGVHANSIGEHNNAKVLYFLGVEGAFLQFGMQVVLPEAL
ncbi:hypothetical protein C0995_006709, partial [Termitomyces sp. Mi166